MAVIPLQPVQNYAVTLYKTRRVDLQFIGRYKLERHWLAFVMYHWSADLAVWSLHGYNQQIVH